MLKFYDSSCADMARQVECDPTYISQIKHGRREPSPGYKVVFASYAVERGPRPPFFELSAPLKFIVEHDNGEAD